MTSLSLSTLSGATILCSHPELFSYPGDLVTAGSLVAPMSSLADGALEGVSWLREGKMQAHVWLLEGVLAPQRSNLFVR